MALVIPPGYAYVAMQLGRTGATKPSFCTFGVSIAVPPFGAADLTILFGLFGGLMENVTPQWNLTAARALVGQDGDPLAIFVDPANVPGTKAGEACPSNTAWLISKETGLAGRKNKGRMFLPGILETVVDSGGFINSVDVSATQTDANTFRTAVTTGGTANTNGLVILHDSTVPGSPTPTPVTSLAVRSQVATQRRRMR